MKRDLEGFCGLECMGVDGADAIGGASDLIEIGAISPARVKLA